MKEIHPSQSIMKTFNNLFFRFLISLFSIMLVTSAEILFWDLDLTLNSLLLAQRNTPTLWFIDFLAIVFVIFPLDLKINLQNPIGWGQKFGLSDQSSQAYGKSFNQRSSVPMLLVGLDFAIAGMNSAFEKRFEYSNQNLVKKEIGELIEDPKHLLEIMGLIHGTLKGRAE